MVDKLAAAIILRRWLDAQAREANRPMKTAKKRALIVFAVTSALGPIALAMVVRTAWRYGDRPAARAPGKVEIEIPQRRDARARSPIGWPAGLIGNPAVFRLYAGQRGVAGRFKAGRYEITAPATPRQILDVLVKGAADELVTVIIPEGKNLVEVAEILDAAGVAGRRGW